MSDSDFDVPAGIDVLRVFCGPDGRHGNALGVVRDGRTYPDEASRQALAGQLGFSETVFVDDPERGHVDIYTPGLRLPIAGHPLVGTAWLLDLEILELPVGEIFARQDGEFTWITARPEWAPPRTLERYASVAEVEALTGPPPGEGWLYVWAWEDEAAGRVRARAFPRRIDERGVSRSGGAGACTGGIVEDEATGAAALLLSAELGRALNITQGRGSQILTAPAPDGTVEIGGRVMLAGRRRTRGNRSSRAAKALRAEREHLAQLPEHRRVQRERALALVASMRKRPPAGGRFRRELSV